MMHLHEHTFIFPFADEASTLRMGDLRKLVEATADAPDDVGVDHERRLSDGVLSDVFTVSYLNEVPA